MTDLQPTPNIHPRHGRGEAPLSGALDESPRIVGAWSEVDPALLDDGRGIAPAFPLDLLPLPWRGWVGDTASSAGAPPDYVVQALLAGVCGQCGAGAVVRVAPSWSEPLLLWQALVGRPSSGMSPALASMRALLASLQDELNGGDATGKPRLLVDDDSTEALAEACANQPRSVLLWRDEPGGRLRLFDDAGEKRLRWLEAWKAGPAVWRGAHKTLRLERCPLSVLLTIRPERLMQALGNDGDDGLPARFLYAWPESPDHRPLAGRRAARDDLALDLLRRIGQVARPPAEPLALAFDPSAAKAFDAFLADLHARLRHADGLEADWMGKGSGTVARLAGVLTLLAWSGGESGVAPKEVGGEQVEVAVRLWSDYLWPHARLLFDRAGPGDTDRQARRVVRWLKANRRTDVTREDVRRHALGRTLDAARTDIVLGRLYAAGALRPVVRVFSAQGGRPAQRWEVNPAVTRAG
jgi:hypothetical protein